MIYLLLGAVFLITLLSMRAYYVNKHRTLELRIQRRDEHIRQLQNMAPIPPKEDTSIVSLIPLLSTAKKKSKNVS